MDAQEQTAKYLENLKATGLSQNEAEARAASQKFAGDCGRCGVIKENLEFIADIDDCGQQLEEVNAMLEKALETQDCLGAEVRDAEAEIDRLSGDLRMWSAQYRKLNWEHIQLQAKYQRLCAKIGRVWAEDDGCTSKF